MKWLNRLFCYHRFIFERNIYGDEINAAGGNRSWWTCVNCGKATLGAKLVREDTLQSALDRNVPT